jgi:tRNA threonylcarbamoyladenosine biosynthesis protein TsaB
MALILHINTALEIAMISLARETTVIAEVRNTQRGDHASWMHPAIKRLLEEQDISVAHLDAIAVINGPGSYTGLRLGLSTAKGFCYAARLPLITISTLEWIAAAVQNEGGDLIVPMIDARRDEVFTAVYDRNLRVKNSPYAMILQPQSFQDLLEDAKIIFAGNGVFKARHFIDHPNAYFSDSEAGAQAAALVSSMRFNQKVFADLAYSEPFYVKEFQTSIQPGS